MALHSEYDWGALTSDGQVDCKDRLTMELEEVTQASMNFNK